MATAKKDEGILVAMTKIEKKTVQLRIVGDSPLIVHAWSTKAKRMMLESQMGKSKGRAKPLRNPVDDFIQSLYWISHKPEYPDDATPEECERAFEEAIQSGAEFGFPAQAVKLAGNSAAYRLGWVKNQMALRGAYYIAPDVGDLLIVHGDQPVMREDTVRIGMGSTDLRYRGEFRNWYMNLTITYTEAFGFDLEALINIINAGGFAVGVGEWRTERDGSFGTYHVETI